jgi:mRNA-degrading endonuclease RelE of RelBE toxin-antitoxin system
MSYKIISIPTFDKDLKSLSKKHRSIPKDYEKLLDDLELNPKMGDEILQNCYKIRMAITSKGKGKSGGARVITYIYIQEETVYLLSIYDKSEHTTISDAVIRELIKSIDLD